MSGRRQAVTGLRDSRVALVGAGNIGRILIERLLAVGVPGARITVCDADKSRAADVTARLGVRTAELQDDAIQTADLLLLATLPRATAEVLGKVAEESRAGQTVVSFAAAVPLRSLEPLVPPGVSVVRVMPNAPSLVGQGMNLVAFGRPVSAEARSLVGELLASLGETLEVGDEQMNWGVGLTGAAMRSLLPVLEGMTQAGVEAGLSPAEARRVAAQVMLGTAALALQTDLSFEQLKAITPMRTVDEEEVTRTFRAAVQEAKDRADELERKVAR